MQIIEDRRELHKIPELELNLPKTMAYLENALVGLRCRAFSPMEGSLCAFFDFGADNAIAFRADCDALPIQERTCHGFPSDHPGAMHACGHDGHMAILLELTRRLDKKERLARNVLLIFQPGEESPGGARLLCDTGLLTEHQVEAIFGLHLWPGLEAGKIFCRENEMMSRASEVNIDIWGRSSHIAKATEGVDAMAAAMELHRRITRTEEALSDHVFRLLKFGRMEAGTVRNAIAGHARLEGSLRAFQDPIFEGLRSSLYAHGREIEQEFGCTVDIHLNEGYPAVMNDPALYRKISALVPMEALDQPSMTAEDFAWYQKFVPGLFCFLGLGDTPALHAADFDFEDSILVKGADFFEKLAENYQ